MYHFSNEKSENPPHKSILSKKSKGRIANLRLMVETLQDEKFKSTDFVVNLEIYKESHGFCIKLFLQKKFEK